MHQIRRRRLPFLRLLWLGMLAISLLGNGWAVAVAAVPAAGEPCNMMMSSGSHADCCDHGQPGKRMPSDCLEHCYLLGQLGASVPLPAVLAAPGLYAGGETLPMGNLATMHLPTRLAPGLRPPISV